MAVIKRKIKVDSDSIDKKHLVTLKSLGNIKEISISDRHNSNATIMPISRDEFILMSTGEVKNFKNHAKSRTENIRNLEKSMRNLADLINTNINIENYDKCRFITLTYRDNERNTEKIYNDFKNFNKRFNRYIKVRYEYIATIEVQERGAFHFHIIYLFANYPPFIDNEILFELWGFGFTSVKSLNGTPDNIGEYLTAYLKNLPVDNEISTELLGGEIYSTNIDGKNKRIIKGARLKMLPSGINLYRCSRGIKKPQTEILTYEEAEKELSESGYIKVSEFGLEISDTERDFNNKYIKQTYKKFINKRSKKIEKEI